LPPVLWAGSVAVARVLPKVGPGGRFPGSLGGFGCCCAGSAHSAESGVVRPGRVVAGWPAPRFCGRVWLLGHRFGPTVAAGVGGRGLGSSPRPPSARPAPRFFGRVRLAWRRFCPKLVAGAPVAHGSCPQVPGLSRSL